ncbi:excinuclease ABC subunit UvrC [Streptomyces californicus]
MVVFEDGLARKSASDRRFQIEGFEGQDDVRSMHEVIGRRFKRYLQEKERTGEGDEQPASDAPATEAAPPAAGPAPGSPENRRKARPPSAPSPASRKQPEARERSKARQPPQA